MNIEALTLFNTSHHQSSIPQAVSSSDICRSLNVPVNSLRSSFRSSEPDNDPSFRRSCSSARESSICSEEGISDDDDDVDSIPFESPPSPHQLLIASSGVHGSLHKLFASATVSKSEGARSISSSRSIAFTPPPPVPVPSVNTSAKGYIQHERTRSSSINSRPPDFRSNGLCSAEILQRQEQLAPRRNHTNSTLVIPSYSTVVPSREATQHRSRCQVDIKHQVDLEYMRSTVTAAGAIQRSRPTSSSNSFGKHGSSRKL